MTSFFTNYRGAPFMEGLFENRALLLMLGGTQIGTFVCASCAFADLNEVRTACLLPRSLASLPACLPAFPAARFSPAARAFPSLDSSICFFHARAQYMELVTEWPNEEFGLLLVGVLAADFAGSLAVEWVAGKLFPLPRGGAVVA